MSSSHDLFNDISECVTPLELVIQGIRAIKTLSSTKVLLLINLSQKNTSKQCQMSRSLSRNKNNKLNQRYAASNTHILQKISNFCRKIEVFEKIK